MRAHWGLDMTRGVRSGRVAKRATKSRAKEPPAAPSPTLDDSDDEGGGPHFVLPKPASSTLHASHNCVYFSDDITPESAFTLNRELRGAADKMRALALLHRTPVGPVRLHLTTNGGEIHAAFTVVDCIRSIQRDGVPVETIVDGFVASAGTLISLAGTRRYMQANAYMLIHELRSGFWGKMSDIQQEVTNLDKLMAHIVRLYVDRTNLTRKALEKLLSKDATWDAAEALSRGLVEEIL